MQLPSVILDETLGIDRRDEPLLGGVPIAKGALAAGGWFMLTNDADEVCHPVTGTPAAWWPDGSVKWLHLCGLVDLRAARRSCFTLSAAKPPARPGLTVRSDKVGTSIDGGLVTVTVGGDQLVQVSDSRPRITGVNVTLSLCRPDGSQAGDYIWQPDAAPTVVSVTDNRCVVRCAGRFSSGERPVAELILFVEVWRDLPEVRLQPVFIYLGTPEADLVRSLSVVVRTPYRGDACAYAFGTERGPGYSDSVRTFSGDGPRWPQARLLQLGSSWYRVDKRVTAGDPWVKAEEGGRSGGWCHLADSSGGITGAMRRFWQEYPHQLSVDAAVGELTFGLWPAAAEPMDLRRYSDTVYGRAIYECPSAAYEAVPIRQHGPSWQTEFGAYGIAKSYELLLRCEPPALQQLALSQKGERVSLLQLAPDAGIAERCRRFATPVLPLTAGEHLARSGVVGQLASAPVADHADIEVQLAKFCDFLVAERERCGWYGQLDFGDVQTCWYATLNRWGFDHGGYAWLNTEGLPDYGLWLMALRSSRSDWLAAAADMTRHNRDIDMLHRGPFRGYGSRHNVNHWGCTVKEWRVSMPLVKRLHYYVTADPWTAEVMRETAALFAEQPRQLRFAPDLGAAAAAALVQAEMTGADEHWQILRNYLQTMADGIGADGRYVKSMAVDTATGIGTPVGTDTHDDRCFFFNRFGGQQVMVEAAELLQHEAAASALVRYADYQLTAQLDECEALQPVMAFAWRQTGRDVFREALAAGLAEVRNNTKGPGPPSPIRPEALNRQHGTNKFVSVFGARLHFCPFGLAVTEISSAR